MVRMSSMLRSLAEHWQIGAFVAAALWSPVALVLLATNDPRGTALALAGLIVSPVVGVLLTPNAIASGGLGAGTAFQFAWMAVSSGAFVFGLLFALLDNHNPLAAVGVGLVGLLVLGIPMLILGTNLALGWVAIVRRIAAMSA